MKKETDVTPVESEKRVRGIKKEFEPIFLLKPRHPETKRGEAIALEYTKENYRKYIQSLLPRWNKEHAPKHWVHSSEYRDEGRVIIIQRSN